MTPLEARTALGALLAPFNVQLDALDVLAPAVRTGDSAAIASFVGILTPLWPEARDQEEAITALQDVANQIEPLFVEVDTFWTRLHQHKQLGRSVGFQP